MKTKYAIKASKRAPWHETTDYKGSGYKKPVAFPSNTALSPSKTFLPFFLTVDIKPRILANDFAPSSLLKPPDIFCFAFGILISLSAKLLVKGTEKSLLFRTPKNKLEKCRKM